MIKQKAFQAGEGKHRIAMFVTITGEGLVVQIFGGEKPHVGAISLSVPGPGITASGRASCSTTVVPLTGHKDDKVARPAAEKIAKVWGSPVVVVAGIHVDNASKKDIQQLIKNCMETVNLLIAYLQCLK